MQSSSMLLQDFIDAPSKAESILDSLTTEQIQLIEATISNVKKRKLNKSVTPPSPPSEVEETIVATPTTNTQSAVTNSLVQATTSSVAAAIATALAAAMTSAVATSWQQQQQRQQQQKKDQQETDHHHIQSLSSSLGSGSSVSFPVKQQTKSTKPPIEPVAEVRDGVEWVSFVYSHNRVMKNYTIRTDLNSISLDDIDDKFKTDNCVYPRANLPKDQYKGNRWSYETECNVLGWKLAWLNMNDISGKRGLIQRAVDSYRNRYPSMRSRRVARQAKLMNGTLRKRKQRGDEEDTLLELMTSLATNTTSSGESSSCSNSAIVNVQQPYVTPTTLETAIVKPANHPKTIAMEDLATGARCRIKINVETVSLDYIPHDFRLANSPFPRHLQATVSSNRPRYIEEKMCNELAWKLAWLNPKFLAGKKNMLQRAIDLYRTKFMPSMPPRKHSSRRPIMPTLINSLVSSPSPTSITKSTPSSISTSPSSCSTTPLTTSALSAQNAQYQLAEGGMEESSESPSSSSPTMSCVSGTTASLDFADCLSLADETTTMTNGYINHIDNNDDTAIKLNSDHSIMFSGSTSPSSISYSSHSPHLPPCFDESSTTISTSSGANSVTCTPSPPVSSELFRLAMDEMYDAFMLPPTASIDDHDTFMFTDLGATATVPDTNASASNASTKLFDPSFLTSPSLPSSALQQDLLVKLENVDDFADQLLGPFF